MYIQVLEVTRGNLGLSKGKGVFEKYYCRGNQKHKDINKSSKSLNRWIGEKRSGLHETEISEEQSGRHLGLDSRALIILDTG